MAAPTATYKLTKLKNAGDKDNPHGGKLFKLYCTFTGPDGVEHDDVYWQSKSAEHELGEEVFGHIEDGQYGPRFKTDQKQNGSAPSGGDSHPGYGYESHPDNVARMARSSAFKGAVRLLAASDFNTTASTPQTVQARVSELTEALLPVVTGGSGVGGGGSPGSTAGAALSAPAADSSAPEEASPALKRKLSLELGKAGIVKADQPKIVQLRCGQLPATKAGAMQLLDDILGSRATFDTLQAELADAGLAVSDVPADTEGLSPPPGVGIPETAGGGVDTSDFEPMPNDAPGPDNLPPF